MLDVSDLLLDLAFELVVLITAALAWFLDNKWCDRGARPSRQLTSWLLGFIVLGSIVAGLITWSNHSSSLANEEQMARIEQDVAELVLLARERNPELSEQEALREIIVELRTLRTATTVLESNLEGLRRYSAVAKLNVLGLSGRYGPGSGLRETTPISQVLENAYERRESEGQITWHPRCDNAGTDAFEGAISINPDFPFAHWALAECARNNGNPAWQTHAQRGVAILEHTTQIADRHEHHNALLTLLKGMLDDQVR